MKIQDKETFDKVNVFGMGQENSAFAQYFIGDSYLNPLTKPGKDPSHSQTSPSSRDAAITGISTTQRQEADRF